MSGPGPLSPDPRPRRAAFRGLAGRADDALGEVLRRGAAHGISAETLLAIL